MMYGSSGRERIQAYVKALAGCAGVDPVQLTFKWEELEGMEMPGVDNRPDDKVQTMRVSLNKCWTTVLFTDHELKSLDRIPEKIFAVHKGEILEALRKLKGLSRPIPESDCLDRWVAAGDSFPGEPA